MAPAASLEALTLEQDGALLLRGAVAEARLGDLDHRLPSPRAGGTRLAGLPWLDCWLAAALLPAARAAGVAPGFRPVRAILFDKTDTNNWALGWHQDRTVAVREKVEAAGYGPWSRKQGLLHVEPPFAVMAGMVTARLHLDPVDTDNAPLRVALGSHRLGRIADTAAKAMAERFELLTCLADRGDLWFHPTPVLHASSAAVRPRRRRVLQVDLAAGDLPGGVEWLGIA